MPVSTVELAQLFRARVGTIQLALLAALRAAWDSYWDADDPGEFTRRAASLIVIAQAAAQQEAVAYMNARRSLQA